jgi:hypothetical protein
VHGSHTQTDGNVGWGAIFRDCSTVVLMLVVGHLLGLQVDLHAECVSVHQQSVYLRFGRCVTMETDAANLGDAMEADESLEIIELIVCNFVEAHVLHCRRVFLLLELTPFLPLLSLPIKRWSNNIRNF